MGGRVLPPFCLRAPATDALQVLLVLLMESLHNSTSGHAVCMIQGYPPYGQYAGGQYGAMQQMQYNTYVAAAAAAAAAHYGMASAAGYSGREAPPGRGAGFPAAAAYPGAVMNPYMVSNCHESVHGKQLS